MNAKSKYRSLHTVFYALIIGQLLFAGVILYLHSVDHIQVPMQEDTEVFLYVSAGVMILAMVVQLVLDRNHHVPGPSVPLSDKVMNYRRLKLSQWALLEGASFVGLVFFMLTTNILYLIIALVGIALLVFLRPNLGEFTRRYRLTQEEKGALG